LYVLCFFFFFFFFSSRRRHTRLQGDWSSDVCSSDLSRASIRRTAVWRRASRPPFDGLTPEMRMTHFSNRSLRRLPRLSFSSRFRSEERRVGKECRCRWVGGGLKKNRESDNVVKIEEL